MKKKQFYEKPSMQVFKLQQQAQLLAGSNPNALNDPEDYLPEDDPFSSAPQLPGGPNLFDF